MAEKPSEYTKQIIGSLDAEISERERSLSEPTGYGLSGLFKEDPYRAALRSAHLEILNRVKEIIGSIHSKEVV